MTDPRYVPMPDVTCGTACTEQHTYRLNECALSCASIDGGCADPSWTVPCPRCDVPANAPCRRANGTASGVSCTRRWTRYDAQGKARPAPPARTATTPKRTPPVTNEAAECPAGVHSVFDPCPGDCGLLLEDTTISTEHARADDPMTFNAVTDAIRRNLGTPSRWPRTLLATPELTPDERERRDRYAAAVRDEIKSRTVPSLIPGRPPTLGATEYDIAAVVLHLADAEHAATTAQVHAERDAALRLADVWDDAPDPLARAMAADLRSAIRGARPAISEVPHQTTEDEATHERPAAGSLPAERCGATSTGMFGHALGPCTHDPDHSSTYHRDAHGTDWCDHATVEQIRAERDRYATALDKVRGFNKLVADGSCRVQAVQQARDTLRILERSLNAPDGSPHAEKGQPR
ncbi:hypothetical protein ACFVJK_46860 [Streptomyces sp. NPDC127172]|uniref:hypothetical protein n=1 Tax=Streptomyces sp. NPDC127172 TaxID=3345382 RepID=UPI00362F8356